MAKRKPSDEEVAAIVAKAIASAEHTTDTKLADERTLVDKYYRGDAPGPMHKGDSKYVSRDVFDSVDSMRSTVLEAYSASTRIVHFKPEHGESVDDARQATEFARHVFFKDNPGEDIMYGAITDGLTARLAVAKVYFEEDEDTEEYEFEALTPEELSLEVGKRANFEFIETDVTPQGLYSGSYAVSSRKQSVRVELLQPEDFLISSSASSVATARFVAHRTNKTRSWFEKTYGSAIADEIQYQQADSALFGYEKAQRYAAIGYDPGHDYPDEASREATLYECYIRTDADGSGRVRLWKIDYAGGLVLSRERVSYAPFATFVPLPTTHTFFGENFAKAVIPVQNARTVLIRQIINHSLITNNPRQQVLNGTLANPAELLDNRLGGIVNVRRLDGIAPIPQAPLNPFIFNLIQMIDEDKEEVTGISKLSQGMNKDAISTQNAQGMVEQLISASQQRTKTVARRFGLFIRELFFLIYNTAVDHMTDEVRITMSGVEAEVDPSMWKNRTAASVELTLGYGEQEAEAVKFQTLDMLYSQDPQLSPLYSLENRYEVHKRILEKRGVEDIDSILKHPSQMSPPKPDPVAEIQLAQLQAQVEYTKAQARAMVAKAETDRLKAETDRMRVANDMQVRQAGVAIDQATLEHDVWVDAQELALSAKAGEQRAVYNPS